MRNLYSNDFQAKRGKLAGNTFAENSVINMLPKEKTERKYPLRLILPAPSITYAFAHIRTVWLYRLFYNVFQA